MRTVEVMTEVEIDLDDYIDEVLEECEDKELIDEVEKRGYKVYEKGVLNVPFGTQYGKTGSYCPLKSKLKNPPSAN
jgi:hypothetical protein